MTLFSLINKFPRCRVVSPGRTARAFHRAGLFTRPNKSLFHETRNLSVARPSTALKYANAAPRRFGGTRAARFPVTVRFFGLLCFKRQSKRYRLSTDGPFETRSGWRIVHFLREKLRDSEKNYPCQAVLKLSELCDLIGNSYNVITSMNDLVHTCMSTFSGVQNYV